MNLLAMLFGKSALVLKEAKIDENGPLYVRIVGRKAGIIAWLFALIGIDVTSKLEIYGNRIEFSASSLSGPLIETIPLSKLSNLSTGYMKPIFWIIVARLCLITALGSLVVLMIPATLVCFILAGIFAFLYKFGKSMFIAITPDSGSTSIIAFKLNLAVQIPKEWLRSPADGCR